MGTPSADCVPREDFVEDRHIAPALGGAATLKAYFFNTLLTSEDHPTPLFLVLSDVVCTILAPTQVGIRVDLPL